MTESVVQIYRDRRGQITKTESVVQIYRDRRGQITKTESVVHVGEWGWGVEGKQVGSMDEESQVRGCYNITFICTPTNQETV